MLDVGTGTGVAAQAAVDAGASAVGIDPSIGMLEVGRRDRPAIGVVAAQAIDLPFRDGTFDAVTGNFVLSHFRRPETALFDMMRVLKPGGRVALTTWSDVKDDLQDTWGELIGDVVPKEMLEPVWADAAPGHARFADRSVVEQTLIDAKLRHVRTEKRKFQFQYTQEDYLTGLEIWATGRFVKEMLGDAGWPAFQERVRDHVRGALLRSAQRLPRRDPRHRHEALSGLSSTVHSSRLRTTPIREAGPGRKDRSWKRSLTASSVGWVACSSSPRVW